MELPYLNQPDYYQKYFFGQIQLGIDNYNNPVFGFFDDFGTYFYLSRIYQNNEIIGYHHFDIDQNYIKTEYIKK